MIKNIKHSCKPHKFQDGRYSSGKRVFTEGHGESGKLTCTVCGSQEPK